MIESIGFGKRPNITNKTIETLISCANNYPKKQLNFYCDSAQNQDINDFQAINLNNFADIMPKNLIIYLSH